MGIASLVLGILGTLFSILPLTFWIGVPLAFIGLILGIVGRKSAITNAQPTGTATAGLVLSVIGLCIGITMTIWCASCIHRAEQDPNFGKMNREQFNEAFKRALQETNKQRPPQPPPPPPPPAPAP